MNVLVGLLQVFFVNFREVCHLGCQLLDLEFVALALGFQDALVLQLYVVYVGLSAIAC